MNRIIGILMLGALISGCTDKTSAPAPWSACFNGLSNHGRTADKIYVTSGKKAQIIGLQDASFPDLGGHVAGEMGGIWTGSFKLADGYWMKVADVISNEDTLLHAREMIVYPHQNEFDFGQVLSGLNISSTQFASDVEPGVVISYTIENTTNNERSVNLGFLLNTDMSPVWFSEENGIRNTADKVEWDKDKEIFLVKDSLNSWHMAWGCDHKIACYEIGIEHVHTKGLVTPTGMYTTLLLQPKQKETVRYVITSSIRSFDEAVDNYQILLKNADKELDDKKQSIETLLSTSEIEIPNKDIENAYYWTLINNRWLEMDVDTIGYYLSAGAVEYPWLFGCDNSYSLQGLLRTGNFDLVKSTLRLLNKVSERTNGNGRIIHEMSSNGFVGNKGNTQETAHYIVALWKAFEWTGDKKLLEDIYPNVKKGITWLTETMDTNKNLFPEGYGIMEVKGLNAELIDVAVYTQQALAVASNMAALLGEDSLAEEYAQKAEMLKQRINTEFWDEKAVSYCDFYGSKSDALKTAKGAIEQARMTGGEESEVIASYYVNLINEINRNYKTDVTKGWFTNKNWVINTPMECKIAPFERAQEALETIYLHNCGKYGPYLSAVEKKHMMTIATGVQAVAEANYGRIDRAIDYLCKIAETLGVNMPGAINEMMPDYGCPFQAWTVYGLATTIVSGCFGIEPYAYLKEFTIVPQFPQGWDRMSLKRLRIGDNYVSFSIEKNKDTYTLIYTSQNEGWKGTLKLPEMRGKTITMNGKQQLVEGDTILLNSRKSTIIIPLDK
ncbi:family 78 glycoside hydrolase catalytic domain [Bacteroides clarus]|uniref:Alpha-L-rhamnosidase six-hairpin glycosidase domain-containing protein n=1 Tax=Bacteroides clarus TaxID=626929 RepID=A0A1Y3Z647_9BACE|nr:family 78 glycoside hydrolase catalytic domain [Bacteroides clarus]OUO03090.1 hypothetical protein B5F97_01315 [Bacteroides clarus]